ncbi:hypothetical protein ZIOFF_012237 [Zingiber officinale]|uniref:Uncharacterized protein n=1 Tax=Zingiber officinale TaxID=94328 RepID=A0A8J5I7L4_ZINOF|nr:hypothetical protein ZIOFF_012237 [Zingiber officinale]
MDAHTRGRRTLEEIRQKRAAERIHKVPSGSDLESSNPYGAQRSESGNRMSGERDTYVLSSQLKDFENRNAELERENQKLLAKLDEKEIQIDSLMKRLNDLEQDSLLMLRKSLKDISIEKDAAIEDALSQLRSIKKRLKEAEEDQYRAEQDAADLRAELNLLQQQGLRGTTHSDMQFGSSPDHILSLEKEILDLKTGLQQELLLRQQEQQKLSAEQLHSSSLLSEKKELEDKLASLNKKISEDASDFAVRKMSSLVNSKIATIPICYI